MELKFEKKGSSYVVTFEAVSDFNLHIEKEQGSLQMYQSTVAGDKFDLVDGFGDKWATGTIDIDFTALVFPKYIRLVSAVEPTKAEVTFAK